MKHRASYKSPQCALNSPGSPESRLNNLRIKAKGAICTRCNLYFPLLCLHPSECSVLSLSRCSHFLAQLFLLHNDFAGWGNYDESSQTQINFSVVFSVVVFNDADDGHHYDHLYLRCRRILINLMTQPGIKS